MCNELDMAVCVFITVFKTARKQSLTACPPIVVFKLSSLHNKPKSKHVPSDTITRVATKYPLRLHCFTLTLKVGGNGWLGYKRSRDRVFQQ